MIDTEKIKIKNLRSMGLGATRIAKETGLSVNTSRHICVEKALRQERRKMGLTARTVVWRYSRLLESVSASSALMNVATSGGIQD